MVQWLAGMPAMALRRLARRDGEPPEVWTLDVALANIGRRISYEEVIRLAHDSEGLRVGIVGGSIAGCSAAIELSRAGHRVTVFERSAGELTGRGAGIATPRGIMGSMAGRDLIDAAMPYFAVEAITYVGLSTRDTRLGHLAWAAPLDIAVLNWGDLYRNLRRRVPEAVYQQGREVMDARMTGADTAVIRLGDGSEVELDLVLFADGYRSLGRQLLFPEADVRYRGYVLWRGVLPESRLDDSAPMEKRLYRIGYPDGHCVFYFVPGQDGSVEPGKRWVNWACYVRVPADDLARFLTDRFGQQRTGSLPPGNMRLEDETRLKDHVRPHLPSYFAAMVDMSEDTFVQPIFTSDVPAYRKGRICLLGDAGAFVQPFTGTGVFKGMNNAMDLGKALAGKTDIDAALESWSAQQTRTGKLLLAMGERLEQALIWATPDFGQMDENATRTWWVDANRIPPELMPR
jgi:2-polyprenyl-6-methoxyphenol hydroxylase-like FAD-dependent oxidoreductase